MVSSVTITSIVISLIIAVGHAEKAKLLEDVAVKADTSHFLVLYLIVECSNV